MNDQLCVDVQVVCESSTAPAADEIRTWIAAAAGAATVRLPAEVSVRIVGEAESRQLNEEFRGRNGATNVLSFPGAGDMDLPAELPQVLGDIVICAPVVESEAADQGKAPGDHWAHMLVHGTLHLLGYDHEHTADAQAMEALETQILADRGVADPYRQ